MENKKAKEAGFSPISVEGEKGVLIQQPSIHDMNNYQPATQFQPPDYLVWSLLNLICCFWPLGLVALIKSIDVRSHHAGGRHREAEVASKSAKMLNKIGFGLGCAIATTVIILTLITFTVHAAVRAAHGGEFNHTMPGHHRHHGH